MILAAPGGGFLFAPGVSTVSALTFALVGLAILVAFVFAARLVARIAGEQLRKRNVRSELIVISRRVVTVIVIVIGLFLAFGFALENSNVPLLGILLATVVASLGVQDLLKDYVSGYYILFERHFRVGDRISFDTMSGTITEVRLRVTLLRSDEGDVIVVPNTELFNKSVTVHITPPEAARREPRE